MADQDIVNVRKAVNEALKAAEGFAASIPVDPTISEEAQEASRYAAAIPIPTKEGAFCFEPVEIALFLEHCFEALLKKKYCIAVREYALPNYVSWLILERQATATQRGRFAILYNTQKIRTQCQTGYCRMKTIAKVFLHELGHAVLHETEYIRAASGQGVDSGVEVPGLAISIPVLKATPAQENEAYLFALTAWARLLGCRAQVVRATGPDNAWEST